MSVEAQLRSLLRQAVLEKERACEAREGLAFDNLKLARRVAALSDRLQAPTHAYLSRGAWKSLLGWGEGEGGGGEGEEEALRASVQQVESLQASIIDLHRSQAASSRRLAAEHSAQLLSLVGEVEEGEGEVGRVVAMALQAESRRAEEERQARAWELETGRLLDVSHELRFHNAQLCSELQQLEAEVSLLRGREEEHSVWRGKLKRAYATWEEAQRREARRIVEREGEREQQHEQEVKEAEARAREFEEKLSAALELARSSEQRGAELERAALQAQQREVRAEERRREVEAQLSEAGGAAALSEGEMSRLQQRAEGAEARLARAEAGLTCALAACEEAEREVEVVRGEAEREREAMRTEAEREVEVVRTEAERDVERAMAIARDSAAAAAKAEEARVQAEVARKAAENVMEALAARGERGEAEEAGVGREGGEGREAEAGGEGKDGGEVGEGKEEGEGRDILSEEGMVISWKGEEEPSWLSEAWRLLALPSVKVRIVVEGGPGGPTARVHLLLCGTSRSHAREGKGPDGREGGGERLVVEGEVEPAIQAMQKEGWGYPPELMEGGEPGRREAIRASAMAEGDLNQLQAALAREVGRRMFAERRAEEAVSELQLSNERFQQQIALLSDELATRHAQEEARRLRLQKLREQKEREQRGQQEEPKGGMVWGLGRKGWALSEGLALGSGLREGISTMAAGSILGAGGGGLSSTLGFAQAIGKGGCTASSQATAGNGHAHGKA